MMQFFRDLRASAIWNSVLKSGIFGWISFLALSQIRRLWSLWNKSASRHQEGGSSWLASSFHGGNKALITFLKLPNQHDVLNFSRQLSFLHLSHQNAAGSAIKTHQRYQLSEFVEDKRAVLKQRVVYSHDFDQNSSVCQLLQISCAGSCQLWGFMLG